MVYVEVLDVLFNAFYGVFVVVYVQILPYMKGDGSDLVKLV